MVDFTHCLLAVCAGASLAEHGILSMTCLFVLDFLWSSPLDPKCLCRTFIISTMKIKSLTISVPTSSFHVLSYYLHAIHQRILSKYQTTKGWSCSLSSKRRNLTKRRWTAPKCWAAPKCWRRCYTKCWSWLTKSCSASKTITWIRKTKALPKGRRICWLECKGSGTKCNSFEWILQSKGLDEPLQLLLHSTRPL